MSEKWLKAEAAAKKILILTVLLGAAILLFLCTPKLLGLFLPFVVAYIISLIASPLTHVFEKIHLPPALSAIISILVVAMALFGISALAIEKIISEVYDFSLNLPELYASVANTFSNLKIAAFDIFELLPGDFSALDLEKVTSSLKESLSGISSMVVETISSATINIVKHVPGILLAIVFSILASYFLIRDKKKLKLSITQVFGETFSAKLHEIKSYLYEAVFAYLKAQCILMSITFAEVFIGLSILNVRYALLFALIIAFVDAIPVFGTGTVLIPWALYNIITGRFSFAAGLIIIYVVCLVVRQFLEPKILSSQIGVHPLLTLLAMYVGFRTIGIIGMILGPLIALITKNLFEKYKENHKTSG